MKNTTLLIMDYQPDILNGVEAKVPTLLKNAKSLIAAARAKKVPVVFVRVAFRPGYPEVSPKNKMFAGIVKAKRVELGTPGAEIHPDLAPSPIEMIVTKHRVGAFSETELQTLLRANGTEHLILAGVSSSGVVLSTTRVAADLDYHITIVSDACADPSDEIHQLLMEKVFPRQADVVDTEKAVSLLNA